MGKVTGIAWRSRLARLTVGAVLLSNLSAALPFLFNPRPFVPAFELEGWVGELLVRSIGLLFLMWVIPYLPVLLDPLRYRCCLIVIITQQIIGLAGESWFWKMAPAGHTALQAVGGRFILFDSAGLFLLLIALWSLRAQSGSTGA